MKNSDDVFAAIEWSREDIKVLLSQHGMDNSDVAVEEYLKNLDIRCFEEQCIEDGWERLAAVLMEHIKG